MKAYITQGGFIAMAVVLFALVAIPVASTYAADWDDIGMNEVGGWDYYGYDNSSWDYYGTDTTNWDYYGTNDASWDYSGTSDASWDYYGYDNSSWDYYGTDTTNWDYYGTNDASWDYYGYDNTDWDYYGYGGTSVAAPEWYEVSAPESFSISAPEYYSVAAPETYSISAPEYYSVSAPSYSYSQPTYSYSQPTYSYSQPTYSYSTPVTTRAVTYAQPTTVSVKPITVPQKTVQYSYPYQYQQQYQYPQYYPQPSCTISATPSVIAQGGMNVTLSWSSSNASTAYLTGMGSVSTAGSRSAYPSQTTTYYLTVYGTNGQSANCQTTVTVNTYVPPVVNPPYCSISLSYNSNWYDTNWTNWNRPATLSWTSSNATSAYVNGIGSVSTSGSQTVYPTSGQTYTMTVYGQGGSNTCQTQATYTYQPIQPCSTYYCQPVQNLSCVLTANPSSIRNGESASLSWTTYGATTAWLSDGIGNAALSGSLMVRPESTRTYTMTVSDGAGRTRECSATVRVAGTQPYVYLTELPYTGFDLGPIGNAMYFLSMLMLAVAAGYLVVYYRGGVLAFATEAMRSRNTARAARVTKTETKKEAAVASAPVAAPAPAREEKKETFSGDTMLLSRSKDGSMPRIVIDRN